MTRLAVTAETSRNKSITSLILILTIKVWFGSIPQFQVVLTSIHFITLLVNLREHWWGSPTALHQSDHVCAITAGDLYCLYLPNDYGSHLGDPIMQLVSRSSPAVVINQPFIRLHQ